MAAMGPRYSTSAAVRMLCTTRLSAWPPAGPAPVRRVRTAVEDRGWRGSRCPDSSRCARSAGTWTATPSARRPPRTRAGPAPDSWSRSARASGRRPWPRPLPPADRRAGLLSWFRVDPVENHVERRRHHADGDEEDEGESGRDRESAQHGRAGGFKIPARSSDRSRNARFRLAPAMIDILACRSDIDVPPSQSIPRHPAPR